MSQRDPYRGLPSLERLEGDLDRAERHLARGWASRHLKLIAGAGAALAIGFALSPAGPAFGGGEEAEVSGVYDDARQACEGREPEFEATPADRGFRSRPRGAFGSVYAPDATDDDLECVSALAEVVPGGVHLTVTLHGPSDPAAGLTGPNGPRPRASERLVPAAPPLSVQVRRIERGLPSFARGRDLEVVELEKLAPPRRAAISEALRPTLPSRSGSAPSRSG